MITHLYTIQSSLIKQFMGNRLISALSQNSSIPFIHDKETNLSNHTYLRTESISSNLQGSNSSSSLSLSIRSREYKMEERSMREIVALYCNSDIILQWDSQYDYFPLFLLPHNAFIEIEDGGKKKWSIDDWREMRVMYYTIPNQEDQIITTIRKAIQSVLIKKYNIGVFSNLVVC